MVPAASYHPLARVLVLDPEEGALRPRLPGKVALLTAGTADLGRPDGSCRVCWRCRKAGLRGQGSYCLCSAVSQPEASTTLRRG